MAMTERGGPVNVPTEFVWSKYGEEAGQSTASIFARKEAERLADGGVFLWGIGASIGPSLRVLLQRQEHPRVLFTPMRTLAKEEDAYAETVAHWHRARTMEGDEWEMPEHALVTSRANSGISEPPVRHFALVCRREEPLTTNEGDRIDPRHLLNLRTGTRPGSSQVTSVVFNTGEPVARPRYRVAFSADLVAPYLVTLEAPTLHDVARA
jgi:hypothetical protein